MHTASSQSSPAPAGHTDLPTNENMMEPNKATEEPVRSSEVDLLKNMSSILKEIRDELKSSNANKERGGGLAEVILAKNISNTLEQAPDNGIKPNNANENPAVSIEGSLAKNMSDTPGQILDVLKGSTIAEERGKDANSKFWATYKKVSTEYDDDFLKWANDDIGIMLTFAGLFSAVNSTFIIGMQPNPGDTTNALLLHLIQITVNGPNSVPDISNLSSSTGYSSWTVWAQTLAYASLAFSVLAAGGAVMGKQWLNSYKAARGRGTLEECGMQRQVKLDGLEYFLLQTVLPAPLFFLIISIWLFVISLSANVWTQKHIMSSAIILISALGYVFYTGINLVSALRQRSLFRTPASEPPTAIPIINMLLEKLTSTKEFVKLTSTKKFVKLSAVRWILETSTNPEILEAAAAIVPLMQWPPKLNASASYARLLDGFRLCGDKPELYVKHHKAMAHLCMQPVKIDSKLVEERFWNDEFKETRGRFIRDAFMAGRAAYDQLNKESCLRSRDVYRADIRTALRTLVVHGQDNRLSRPDDEDLIWDGDLRWRHSDGRKPSCEEFDWLVDYLAGDAEHRTDDETEGDALLALSFMQGLGSSTKQQSYISSLIRCMDSARPPRVRHTALRAVFEAREELASITSASMPTGVDTQLLDELSRGLLTAVDGQIIHDTEPDASFNDTEPDASFHADRDSCYIRIIYALTKNDEWFQRLARDGHDQQCFSLVDGVCQNHYLFIELYLLVVFWRIKSSGKDLPFSPTQENWRSLVKNTWETLEIVTWSDNAIDGIPAIVTLTRLNLTASDNGVPREWFTDLAAIVHKVLVKSQREQATLVNNGIGQTAIDTALSSIQGLHDDLGCVIEQRNPSQRDHKASGS